MIADDNTIDRLRAEGELIGTVVRDEWTRNYLAQRRKTYLQDHPTPVGHENSVMRSTSAALGGPLTGFGHPLEESTPLWTDGRAQARPGRHTPDMARGVSSSSANVPAAPTNPAVPQ